MVNSCQTRNTLNHTVKYIEVLEVLVGAIEYACLPKTDKCFNQSVYVIDNIVQVSIFPVIVEDDNTLFMNVFVITDFHELLYLLFDK